MQGLQNTVLKHPGGFFPGGGEMGGRKSLEHPVYFQTVIFKFGQADPAMVSENLIVSASLHSFTILKTVDVRQAFFFQHIGLFSQLSLSSGWVSYLRQRAQPTKLPILRGFVSKAKDPSASIPFLLGGDACQQKSLSPASKDKGSLCYGSHLKDLVHRCEPIKQRQYITLSLYFLWVL